MHSGSITLGEFEFRMVRLACRKCDRVGQYSRARLVNLFGPDKPMPDLRSELVDCPRLGQMHDPCAAYFIDLAS